MEIGGRREGWKKRGSEREKRNMTQGSADRTKHKSKMA